MAEVGTDEEQIIREKFPTFAIWLDHAEVGPLLRQAVAESWDPARLRARLEATEFWKTTQASRRTWDSDYAHDPASMEAKIRQEQLAIRNLTGQYGLTHLTDQDTRELAVTVLRDGLDQQQLLGQLAFMARSRGAQYGPNDPGLQGGLRAIYDQIADQARQYHLSYSAQQLRERAIQVFEGRSTLEAQQASFRQQATAYYPQLADAFERGETMETFFAPLKNRVAQTLELAPEQIDLTSPQWSQMTQMVNDKGQVRPMTMTEAAVWARTNKRDLFYQTREAQEQVYGSLNKLASTFGAK